MDKDDRDYQKWIIPHEKARIYLPNEIFLDLQIALTNGAHIAFAYCYYYLICYLYRYTQYIGGDGKLNTQPRIKKFLGYAEENKTVDFIIKKGGVLDSIGYTETTTDYPLLWHYDAETHELSFETIADLKTMDTTFVGFINDRNFKIKKPVKAFFRAPQDMQRAEWFTGTFYDIRNTHEIEPRLFHTAMTNQNIGVVGLYLYGFLKHKCSYYGGGYSVPWERLMEETKLSSMTLSKYLKKLEDGGYISIKRTKYVHGKTKDIYASTYRVKSFKALKPKTTGNED
jgi:hypothetical protein